MDEKGSSSSSRWNPTKEQITVLEGLYKQGIRTPTAEQIQQITAKLREYGGIEGKNVFYWFQNHKARQRQKMKQEGMAYYSRMMSGGPGLGPFVGHGPLPHPPQGCGNVMCPPYCFPVPPPFSPSHHPTAFIPATGPWPTNMVGPIYYPQRSGPRPNGPYIMPHPINSTNANMDTAQSLPLETLELFPLHPTRTSQPERSSSSLTSASHTSKGVEEGEEVGENGSSHASFYNFFG